MYHYHPFAWNKTTKPSSKACENNITCTKLTRLRQGLRVVGAFELYALDRGVFPALRLVRVGFCCLLPHLSDHRSHHIRSYHEQHVRTTSASRQNSMNRNAHCSANLSSQVRLMCLSVRHRVTFLRNPARQDISLLTFFDVDDTTK